MAKKMDEEDGDTETVLDRLTRVIELLAAQNNPNEALQAKLAAALERVAEAQLQGSALIASETRRAHRPSNEVVPQVSVFNRRGVLLDEYQKPRLKCLMLIPWLAEWESLTREEVELLNLLESGEFAISRIDKTQIRVTVRIETGLDSVTPSRLLLNHDTAFNNDNFRLAPALTDMLRQILKKSPNPETRKAAAEVMSDEEEEAMIEAGQLTISV